MDPLLALGATCNVLQLFDLTWKLLSGARAIYQSVDGAAPDAVFLEALLENVAGLRRSISASGLPLRLHALCKLSEDLAVELSAILDTLKTRGHRRRWQSFKVALREIRTKKEINNFVLRIQQLQTQILIDVQFLMMDKQSALYQEVLSLKEMTQNLGANLDTHVDNLRDIVVDQLSYARTANVESLIEHLCEDVQQLSIRPSAEVERISRQIEALSTAIAQLQTDMLTTRNLQGVLRFLKFESLEFRLDSISTAHRMTFEWVLDGEHDDTRGPTNFTSWLQNADSRAIFWVRGKPGSGKSTLMKFLCNDSRTVEHLRGWAGERNPLVIAKHFFWSAGASLQKSLEGFVRSLLFDVLRQCPNHLRVAERRFHHKVNDAEALITETLRPGVLWEMLQDLIRENATTRICFFIDGLDEFEDESGIIVIFVEELARHQNTKVCVSSRPWAEFIHKFGGNSSYLLKLEDLTKRDIQMYVSETLMSNQRFKRLSEQDGTAAQLMEEIVQKSDGVFLWVYLVVRSLLEGMKYADSTSFLWKRLRGFPTDLEEFFCRMLRDIKPIYRSKTVQTFQTAMVPTASMPAMVYHYIERSEETDGFPLEDHWISPSEDEVATLIQETTLKLDGWTKGLLEVVHHHRNRRPSYELSKVEFIHRTVFDFFQESKTVHDLFDTHSDPGFDVYDRLCHGLLAYVKFHPQSKTQFTDYNVIMDIFYYAALVSDDEWRIQRIHPVLDETGRALRVDNQHWKDTPTANTMCEYAAEYGLKDYIDEIVRTCNLVYEGSDNRSLEELYTNLLWIALRLKRTSDQHERPWGSIVGLVSFLVDRGANPNQGLGDTTIWQQFVIDFKDCLLKGDACIVEICRVLLMGGADPDISQGLGFFFRDEIGLVLPYGH
ncbi:NACHT nucleoside triphosphatase [Rhypophila decipiens]